MKLNKLNKNKIILNLIKNINLHNIIQMNIIIIIIKVKTKTKDKNIKVNKNQFINNHNIHKLQIITIKTR